MEEPTFPYAVANSPPTPTLRRRPWVSMRAIGPRNRRAAHDQESAKPVRTGGKTPSRLAQPVPDAGLSHQRPRARGIGLELCADVGDVHPQVVHLLAVFGPPFLQQLAMGHQPALVLGEHASRSRRAAPLARLR